MFDDMREVRITAGITQQPELKYTTTGTALLKLNLGSTERKKVNNEYENVSHYYEATVWGSYAEMLSNKLNRGDKVLVMGTLDFQKWEKEGQTRSKLTINASSVKPLSQINNQQGQQNYGNNQKPNNSYQNYQQNNQGGSGNFEGDSIPF